MYDIKVPREPFESIRIHLLSYRSRGTVMSYTVHSAQRRLKSNAPIVICGWVGLSVLGGRDLVFLVGGTYCFGRDLGGCDLVIWVGLGWEGLVFWVGGT